MRTALSVTVAALLTACHTAAITPPRTTRLELLQTAVETGVDASWSDRCVAPLLWAVLDGHEGERRLNRLITEPGGSSHCASLPAEARLIRRYRLGPIDLRAELAQPFPEVRSAALALVRRQHLTQLAEPVRLLLRDSDATVRLDAIATVKALGDTRAVPHLVELLADSPEQLVRGRLCSALHTLAPEGGTWSETCGPAEGEIATGRLQVPSAEQEQLCNEENARVRGLLAVGDWKALAKPLLGFLSREYSDVAASLRYGRAGSFVACRLHPDIRDQLLEPDPGLRVPRAIVAATLLWQIHPRVGSRMLDAADSLPAASWAEPPWTGPRPLGPGNRALPTPLDVNLFSKETWSNAPSDAGQGQP